MLLFLDFDGVLHPEAIAFSGDGMVRPEGNFSRVPLFEEVMREFPAVDIVISSAWRELNSLDTLRGFFSVDIAARIIDATPVMPLHLLGRRETEIRVWLRQAGRENEPFLAVDDWPALFSPECEFLFCIDPLKAFDQAAADALRQRLKDLA